LISNGSPGKSLHPDAIPHYTHNMFSLDADEVEQVANISDAIILHAEVVLDQEPLHRCSLSTSVDFPLSKITAHFGSIDDLSATVDNSNTLLHVPCLAWHDFLNRSSPSTEVEVLTRLIEDELGRRSIAPFRSFDSRIAGPSYHPVDCVLEQCHHSWSEYLRIIDGLSQSSPSTSD